MYAITEVMFVLATVIVLAACVAMGFSVASSARRAALETYMDEVSATIELLDYYSDVIIYSPLPFEGYSELKGG